LRAAAEPKDSTRLKLTSSAASDEAEVVEFGHLVLHDGRAVPQLGAVVLVVAGADGDQGAVEDVAEGHHLEGDGQSLVGAPVRRQHGAHELRAARPHQLAGPFGQDFGERAFGEVFDGERLVGWGRGGRLGGRRLGVHLADAGLGHGAAAAVCSCGLLGAPLRFATLAQLENHIAAFSVGVDPPHYRRRPNLPTLPQRHIKRRGIALTHSHFHAHIHWRRRAFSYFWRREG